MQKDGTEQTHQGAVTLGKAAERVLSFGPASYCEASRTLHVQGSPVAIDRKPLAVLQALLARPGRLVSKDELAAACWPRRIVSDGAVARTVSRLREVLGDTDQQLIRTLHGQGYRLQAEVRVENSPPTRARRSGVSTAGRRQITVAFCELGSGEHRALAGDLVARYGGLVSETLGSGLVLCFGHPHAHEDDAERAVRCTYDLLRALRQAGDADSVRAGVHTGSVLIGEDADPVSLGLTTSLAVRLQECAGAGALLISPATYKLVRGQFITREEPAIQLKGVEAPLPVYQVLQPSGVRSRLEAAATLTPWVGREQELMLLKDRWERVQESQGHACLITGEPGMGKSRLLLALRERIAEAGHTWLECRCSALTAGSAYAPFADLLRRALGIRDDDSEAVRLQRLEQSLDTNALPRADCIPLLAPLLDLRADPRYPPRADSPALLRRRTLDLLAGWLMMLARRQPVLLVVEDLHWADPSSLELISRLVEHCASSAVLLLLSARPEYRPPWPAHSHLTLLTLPPLRRAESARLLQNLAGSPPLPEALAADLLQRAGGVPLFLEELMQTLQESGQIEQGGDQWQLSGVPMIPSSLQDSLAARIDSLGDARALLQTCAVMGREVPHTLLRAVAGLDDLALEEDLRLLMDAQVLYASGTAPQLSYRFKHALIQDSAYASLLPQRRAALHQRIAQALEDVLPELARREPALLAEHYEKGGDANAALCYLQQAAEAAAARSAVHETLGHLRRALRLLASLPVDETRERQELALLILNMKWLGYGAGYASPELEGMLGRARQLSERHRDIPAQMVTLNHQYISHHFAARLAPAVSTGHELIALGARTGLPMLQSSGLSAVAASSYLRGDFHTAMEAADQSLAGCDLERVMPWVAATGFDPAVTAYLVHCYAWWCLGYPERALAAAQACRERARAVGYPHVRCVAEAFAVPVVHRYRREAAALARSGAEALTFSEQHAYEDGRARALKSLAVGLCLEGRRAEGLQQLQQVMAVQRRIGAYAAFTWDCATVAEFSLAEGRVAQARAALDEGQALVQRCGERFWEPELQRLEGDWVLASGGEPSRAEDCYRQALQTAEPLQARMLALRAAVSLARLQADTGRPSQDGRQQLQTIYATFSEGHATPDLLAARALLDPLA